MNDTTVQCEECGNEEAVSFENCLAEGWPKCCGHIMTMKETNANIGDAIGNKVGKPLRKFLDAVENFKEPNGKKP